MKRKVHILILILCITILSLINYSYAANSVNFSISKPSANPGDTVTATLTISSDTAIGGLQSSVSYDNSKLELQSGTPGNGWYNWDSGTDLSLTPTTSNKMTEATYILTFKVKEGVTGEASIFSSSTTIMGIDEGALTSTLGGASAKIKIIESTPKPEETPTPSQKPTETNTSNKVPTKLPATGSEEEIDEVLEPIKEIIVNENKENENIINEENKGIYTNIVIIFSIVLIILFIILIIIKQKKRVY